MFVFRSNSGDNSGVPEISEKAYQSQGSGKT
jgi:hypothetical protein